MKILITGCAGFIGAKVSEILLSRGYQIFGIDNLNNYYDKGLKQSRLNKLLSNVNFQFNQIDISNAERLNKIFEVYQPTHVIHLAAQAGVRHSIDNPDIYIKSNILGFFNVINSSRNIGVEHFIYASSSSVYGKNNTTPYNEAQFVDLPMSLYAATKKSDELIAHSFSNIYGLPTTGLRLFTVYGPWGRPDMAIYKFTKSIIEGAKIQVFNSGNMYRDFTYIDDTSNAIISVLDKSPNFNSQLVSSNIPYNIFNVGNNSKISLIELISLIEEILGIKAHIEYLPLQAGDTLETMADTSKLNAWTGYKSTTSIRDGLKKYIDWHLDYYRPV